MSGVRFTPAVCRMRQTGRLTMCCVSIPPWVGIAICAFSNRWCGYRSLLVHFWLVRFFRRFRRRCEGTRGNDRGNSECGMRNSELKYGAVLRGKVRFCVSILALLRFPPGVRWGLRAPKPAPKSLRLSGPSSCNSRPCALYAAQIDFALSET